MSLEKEFVSYEHSVAVRELGFDEKCIATVENNGYVHIKGTRGLPSAAAVVNKVDAPLKQQVFRWFREKYNLHIDIYPFEIFESDAVVGYKYFFSTYHIIECYANRDEERLGHTTYEEAEDACIDHLILIAKQQDK